MLIAPIAAQASLLKKQNRAGMLRDGGSGGSPPEVLPLDSESSVVYSVIFRSILDLVLRSRPSALGLARQGQGGAEPPAGEW
jgi:hypothetical protein